MVTSMFVFLPEFLISLFIDGDSQSGKIAEEGFPYFSIAFVFFIFNLTVIGYFQSVEKVIPSIVFALMIGVIFDTLFYFYT